MLFNRTFKLDPHFTIIQVHSPRTGGTSLRLLFNKLFGTQSCLMTYEGEIHELPLHELRQYRLISSHLGYGLHQRLSGQALYVTAVRHPVDRLLSTFATFLTDINSKHYSLAQAHDINSFLRVGLNSKPGPLREQFHNLQCRLVCGQPSFALASSYIDHRYFLACPFSETTVMSEMIAGLLGASAPPLPNVHESKPKLVGYEDRMELTRASLELLLEHEREDFLLYNYVQKAFAEVRLNEGYGSSLPPPADASVRTIDGPDMLRELCDLGAELRDGEHLHARLLVIPEVGPWSKLTSLLEPTVEVGIWQRRSDSHNSPRFACEEMRLLSQLARNDLEISSQQAGDWLQQKSADPTCDRIVVQRRRRSLATVDIRECNLCGGQTFAPGPGLRPADNGRAPTCLACGSLERNRIQYRILQALRIGFWQQRRACQFGNSLPALPWSSLDTLPEETPDASFARLAHRANSYDFITMSHLLELVDDDRKAFNLVQKALSRQGMLLIMFGDPEGREHTTALAPDASPWGNRRAYGRDLPQYFDCQKDGLSVLRVSECDPATRVRQHAHLFFKDQVLANQVHRWIEDFSPSAKVTNCLATAV